MDLIVRQASFVFQTTTPPPLCVHPSVLVWFVLTHMTVRYGETDQWSVKQRDLDNRQSLQTADVCIPEIPDALSDTL